MDLKRDARRRAGRRATQDCTLMPAMSLEHEVVRAVLVSAPQLTGRARTLLQAGASTSVFLVIHIPRVQGNGALMDGQGGSTHGRSTTAGRTRPARRTATLYVLQRCSSRTAAETQKKWCPLNTRASAKQNASRTASRATPPTGCPALDSDHVRRGRIRDGSEQLRGGRRAACERCSHAGCHDTERFSRRHGAGRTVCH